jgi:hypothetical protein
VPDELPPEELQISAHVGDERRPLTPELTRMVNGLLQESLAMREWASDKGSPPAPWAVEAIAVATEQWESFRTSGGADAVDVLAAVSGEEGLAAAHRYLSTLVRPARPRTIARLADERQRRPVLSVFGPLPIVRRLVASSVALLVAFVVLAASPGIRNSTDDSLKVETTTSLTPPTTVRP